MLSSAGRREDEPVAERSRSVPLDQRVPKSPSTAAVPGVAAPWVDETATAIPRETNIGAA